MWSFEDKKQRPVCLIPEVTGILQDIWDNDWSKKYSSRKVFYVNRCYRYERPQRGRYREFTQIGAEYLGANAIQNEMMQDALVRALNVVGVDCEIKSNVKRGLNYYVENGFEAIVESLGAQKQIAGGGRYKQGVGWAIGVDRVLLCLE